MMWGAGPDSSSSHARDMPGAGASARKRRGGASWLLLWSCWTHVSHSTLVAHYSFDDETATEDSDSSLDGTTGQYGIGGALAFDGSDDYVEFPSAVTADILGGDGVDGGGSARPPRRSRGGEGTCSRPCFCM